MTDTDNSVGAVLDLHDTAIRLWHGDDCVLSPGYVWFDDQNYHYGSPAMHSARRQPRAVNTRFWWQLSTQALTPALGPARHSADLVHNHLQALHQGAGQPNSITLIAPGSMSREQLSLLLGIVGALPFSIDAIVHRSALAAAMHCSGTAISQATHLELQLHQMVVTETRVEDGHAHAENSQVLPGLGFIHLMDKLASAIAEQFVLQTRFDPSRRAESEQLLYNALPQLLTDIDAQGETRLTIDGYQARIATEHLHTIGQQMGTAINAQLAHEGRTLLLDPMLARIPGLRLSGNAWEVVPESLLQPLLEHGSQLRQGADALAFQTRVPLSHSIQHDVESSDPSQNTAVEQAQPATHLLTGHTAQALDLETTLESGAKIILQDGVLSLHGEAATGVFVNGEPAQSGQRLSAGDRLTDSLGFDAQLIIVER